MNEKFILLKNSSDRIGILFQYSDRIGFGLDNFGSDWILNIRQLSDYKRTNRSDAHLYCPLRAQKETYLKQTRIAKKRDFQDDVSTISTRASESSTDNETEEEMYPWIPLIEEAKQRSNIAFENMKESLINSGLDEQFAKDRAYFNILPKFQKELENIYMECIVWMRQLKKDPVHKKIMHIKDELVENDEFDPEEAMGAAVDKRKFLIRRLLKGYKFDDDDDDDDEENDDDT